MALLRHPLFYLMAFLRYPLFYLMVLLRYPLFSSYGVITISPLILLRLYFNLKTIGFGRSALQLRMTLHKYKNQMVKRCNMVTGKKTQTWLYSISPKAVNLGYLNNNNSISYNIWSSWLKPTKSTMVTQICFRCIQLIKKRKAWWGTNVWGILWFPQRSLKSIQCHW